ncbi:hypothetical protein QBC32DRAFT_36388 [Pseudoneurospora amorphoporcata]|uniref:Uncharacterized protein n=1 Tax=Pseudoneurospora amorphoporcata TaxID=241081 RepID=A0AAN6NT43_9PEZI|nr:hypothetical protein QBC32DRAFT_36388 [Pseudoneurospora amorphoporcata]
MVELPASPLTNAQAGGGDVEFTPSASPPPPLSDVGEVTGIGIATKKSIQQSLDKHQSHDIELDSWPPTINPEDSPIMSPEEVELPISPEEVELAPSPPSILSGAGELDEANINPIKRDFKFDQQSLKDTKIHFSPTINPEDVELPASPSTLSDADDLTDTEPVMVASLSPADRDQDHDKENKPFIGQQSDMPLFTPVPEDLELEPTSTSDLSSPPLLLPCRSSRSSMSASEATAPTTTAAAAATPIAVTTSTTEATEATTHEHAPSQRAAPRSSSSPSSLRMTEPEEVELPPSPCSPAPHSHTDTAPRPEEVELPASPAAHETHHHMVVDTKPEDVHDSHLDAQSPRSVEPGLDQHDQHQHPISETRPTEIQLRPSPKVTPEQVELDASAPEAESTPIIDELPTHREHPQSPKVIADAEKLELPASPELTSSAVDESMSLHELPSPSELPLLMAVPSSLDMPCSQETRPRPENVGLSPSDIEPLEEQELPMVTELLQDANNSTWSTTPVFVLQNVDPQYAELASFTELPKDLSELPSSPAQNTLADELADFSDSHEVSPSPSLSSAVDPSFTKLPNDADLPSSHSSPMVAPKDVELPASPELVLSPSPEPESDNQVKDLPITSESHEAANVIISTPTSPKVSPKARPENMELPPSPQHPQLLPSPNIVPGYQFSPEPISDDEGLPLSPKDEYEDNDDGSPVDVEQYERSFSDDPQEEGYATSPGGTVEHGEIQHSPEASPTVEQAKHVELSPASSPSISPAEVELPASPVEDVAPETIESPSSAKLPVSSPSPKSTPEDAVLSPALKTAMDFTPSSEVQHPASYKILSKDTGLPKSLLPEAEHEDMELPITAAAAQLPEDVGLPPSPVEAESKGVELPTTAEIHNTGNELPTSTLPKFSPELEVQHVESPTPAHKVTRSLGDHHVESSFSPTIVPADIELPASPAEEITPTASEELPSSPENQVLDSPKIMSGDTGLPESHFPEAEVEEMHLPTATEQETHTDGEQSDNDFEAAASPKIVPEEVELLRSPSPVEPVEDLDVDVDEMQHLHSRQIIPPGLQRAGSPAAIPEDAHVVPQEVELPASPVVTEVVQEDVEAPGLPSPAEPAGLDVDEIQYLHSRQIIPPNLQRSASPHDVPEEVEVAASPKPTPEEVELPTSPVTETVTETFNASPSSSPGQVDVDEAQHLHSQQIMPMNLQGSASPHTAPEEVEIPASPSSETAPEEVELPRSPSPVAELDVTELQISHSTEILPLYVQRADSTWGEVIPSSMEDIVSEVVQMPASPIVVPEQVELFPLSTSSSPKIAPEEINIPRSASPVEELDVTELQHQHSTQIIPPDLQRSVSPAIEGQVVPEDIELPASPLEKFTPEEVELARSLSPVEREMQILPLSVPLYLQRADSTWGEAVPEEVELQRAPSPVQEIEASEHQPVSELQIVPEDIDLPASDEPASPTIAPEEVELPRSPSPFDKSKITELQHVHSAQIIPRNIQHAAASSSGSPKITPEEVELPASPVEELDTDELERFHSSQIIPPHIERSASPTAEDIEVPVLPELESVAEPKVAPEEVELPASPSLLTEELDINELQHLHSRQIIPPHETAPEEVELPVSPVEQLNIDDVQHLHSRQIIPWMLQRPASPEMQLPASPKITPEEVELPASPEIVPQDIELPASPIDEPEQAELYILTRSDALELSSSAVVAPEFQHEHSAQILPLYVQRADSTWGEVVEHVKLPVSPVVELADEQLPIERSINLERDNVPEEAGVLMESAAVELTASPMVKPEDLELPASPEIVPEEVELPLSPTVELDDEQFPAIEPEQSEGSINLEAEQIPEEDMLESVHTELPSSPMTKPEDVELPASPEVVPEDVELFLSPTVELERQLPIESVAFGVPSSPKAKPEDLELPPSPEVVPEEVELPASPMVELADEQLSVEPEQFTRGIQVLEEDIPESANRELLSLPIVKPEDLELPASPEILAQDVELPSSPVTLAQDVELPSSPVVELEDKQLPVEPIDLSEVQEKQGEEQHDKHTAPEDVELPASPATESEPEPIEPARQSFDSDLFYDAVEGKGKQAATGAEELTQQDDAAKTSPAQKWEVVDNDDLDSIDGVDSEPSEDGLLTEAPTSKQANQEKEVVAAAIERSEDDAPIIPRDHPSTTTTTTTGDGHHADILSREADNNVDLRRSAGGSPVPTSTSIAAAAAAAAGATALAAATVNELLTTTTTTKDDKLELGDDSVQVHPAVKGAINRGLDEYDYATTALSPTTVGLGLIEDAPMDLYPTDGPSPKLLSASTFPLEEAGDDGGDYFNYVELPEGAVFEELPSEAEVPAHEHASHFTHDPPSEPEKHEAKKARKSVDETQGPETLFAPRKPMPYSSSTRETPVKEASTAQETRQPPKQAEPVRHKRIRSTEPARLSNEALAASLSPPTKSWSTRNSWPAASTGKAKALAASFLESSSVNRGSSPVTPRFPPSASMHKQQPPVSVLLQEQSQRRSRELAANYLETFADDRKVRSKSRPRSHPSSFLGRAAPDAANIRRVPVPVDLDSLGETVVPEKPEPEKLEKEEEQLRQPASPPYVPSSVNSMGSPPGGHGQGQSHSQALSQALELAVSYLDDEGEDVGAVPMVVTPGVGMEITPSPESSPELQPEQQVGEREMELKTEVVQEQEHEPQPEPEEADDHDSSPVWGRGMSLPSVEIHRATPEARADQEEDVESLFQIPAHGHGVETLSTVMEESEPTSADEEEQFTPVPAFVSTFEAQQEAHPAMDKPEHLVERSFSPELPGESAQLTESGVEINVGEMQQRLHSRQVIPPSPKIAPEEVELPSSPELPAEPQHTPADMDIDGLQQLHSRQIIPPNLQRSASPSSQIMPEEVGLPASPALKPEDVELPGSPVEEMIPVLATGLVAAGLMLPSEASKLHDRSDEEYSVPASPVEESSRHVPDNTEVAHRPGTPDVYPEEVELPLSPEIKPQDVELPDSPSPNILAEDVELPASPQIVPEEVELPSSPVNEIEDVELEFDSDSDEEAEEDHTPTVEARVPSPEETEVPLPSAVEPKDIELPSSPVESEDMELTSDSESEPEEEDTTSAVQGHIQHAEEVKLPSSRAMVPEDVELPGSPMVEPKDMELAYTSEPEHELHPEGGQETCTHFVLDSEAEDGEEEEDDYDPLADLLPSPEVSPQQNRERYQRELAHPHPLMMHPVEYSAPYQHNKYDEPEEVYTPVHVEPVEFWHSPELRYHYSPELRPAEGEFASFPEVDPEDVHLPPSPAEEEEEEELPRVEVAVESRAASRELSHEQAEEWESDSENDDEDFEHEVHQAESVAIVARAGTVAVLGGAAAVVANSLKQEEVTDGRKVEQLVETDEKDEESDGDEKKDRREEEDDQVQPAAAARGDDKREDSEDEGQGEREEGCEGDHEEDVEDEAKGNPKAVPKGGDRQGTEDDVQSVSIMNDTDTKSLASKPSFEVEPGLDRQDSETMPKAIRAMAWAIQSKRREESHSPPRVVQRTFSFPDDIADEEAYTMIEGGGEGRHAGSHATWDQQNPSAPMSTISDYAHSYNSLPTLGEEDLATDDDRNKSDKGGDSPINKAANITGLFRYGTPIMDPNRDSGFSLSARGSPQMSRYAVFNEQYHQQQLERQAQIKEEDLRERGVDVRDFSNSPSAGSDGTGTGKVQEPVPESRAIVKEQQHSSEETKGETRQDKAAEPHIPKTLPGLGVAAMRPTGAFRSVAEISQQLQSSLSGGSQSPTWVGRPIPSNTGVARLQRSPEPLNNLNKLRPDSPGSTSSIVSSPSHSLSFGSQQDPAAKSFLGTLAEEGEQGEPQGEGEAETATVSPPPSSRSLKAASPTTPSRGGQHSDTIPTTIARSGSSPTAASPHQNQAPATPSPPRPNTSRATSANSSVLAGAALALGTTTTSSPVAGDDNNKNNLDKDKSKDKHKPAVVTTPRALSVALSATPVANEGRTRSKGSMDVPDVYDGLGEGRLGSPRSPARPPSLRKRQSVQLNDLETRLAQLMAENAALQKAKNDAEAELSQRNADLSSILADKNLEIENLQREIRDTQETCDRLQETYEGLKSSTAAIAVKHSEKVRELDEQVRKAADELAAAQGGHEQYTKAIAEKDAQIAHLRAQLDAQTAQINDLREQIEKKQQQETARSPEPSGADDFLDLHDVDYFDQRLSQLCAHVQQWVLRFSKFSDMRHCRLTSEINDEKLIDRLDNAVLDGSDVDVYLADRVRRRDVFMSMVMTMIYEFVFTRFLFGMDRDQRQRLKYLEKQLSETGPVHAVRQWRAVTLTLLSQRRNYKSQRDRDTEAVVQAILDALDKILPPPSDKETVILEQLRRVVREAVALSIQMRCQRAEYIMLPPLQPEYDESGDLIETVSFNAALMNERSGDAEVPEPEELERMRATVRVVLFPLVIRKGDDWGRGDDEVVVCPAQVLVQRPRKQRRGRVVSGGKQVAREPVQREPVPPQGMRGDVTMGSQV